MTSWLVRLSSENGYTVNEFLSTYVRKVEWRRIDLDRVPSEVWNDLSTRAAINNEETLKQMNLQRWGFVSSTNDYDTRSWISKLSSLRYCNNCLEGDPTPYSRLEWRLLFAPICRIHGKVLSSGLNTDEYALQSDVSPEALELVSSLVGSYQVPRRMNWPYDTDSYLSVLRFLRRYFRLYLDKDTGLGALLRPADGPRITQSQWRSNELVNLGVVELSCAVLDDWPQNFLTFARPRQGKINRLLAQYGAPFPPFLKDLSIKLSTNSKFFDLIERDQLNSMQNSSSSLQKRVAIAEKLLKEAGFKPTVTSIARLTGIDKRKICKNSLVAR